MTFASSLILYDDNVMRALARRANLDRMAMKADGIVRFVLQEFRLSSIAVHASVARIVSSSRRGIELPIPLLTSIADQRDVAVITALHADESRAGDAAHRAALAPFVRRWREPTEYSPRMSERSESRPSHFRLAVTESGINNAASSPLAVTPGNDGNDAPSTHLGLLWIGLPIGTHAGLLVLLGDDGPSSEIRSAREWPLPLSTLLGVRIYEGS